MQKARRAVGCSRAERRAASVRNVLPLRLPPLRLPPLRLLPARLLLLLLPPVRLLPIVSAAWEGPESDVGPDQRSVRWLAPLNTGDTVRWLSAQPEPDNAASRRRRQCGVTPRLKRREASAA